VSPHRLPRAAGVRQALLPGAGQGRSGAPGALGCAAGLCLALAWAAAIAALPAPAAAETRDAAAPAAGTRTAPSATVTTLPPAARQMLPGGAAAAANEPDAAGGSGQQSPVVQFSTPGLHTVTLTSCNAIGCSLPISQQVLVLDPHPVLAATTVAPAQAYVGQQIVLGALATGQPVLSYSWQVFLLQGQTQTQVAALAGSPAIWNTAGLAAGSYTVQLAVTNGAGGASSSAGVVLLPQLADAFFSVTPCRAIDTRSTTSPLLNGASPRVMAIAGACGIPATARAVAANVTAVNPSTGGVVNVYPADYTQSFVTLLSFNSGTVRHSFAVLPLSTDGLGQLAATTTASRVDLLVDVSGYFAPSP